MPSVIVGLVPSRGRQTPQSRHSRTRSVPFAAPAAEHLVDANWLDYVLVAIYFVFVIGGFLLWARLKPIIVPLDVERAEDDPTRPAPRRRPGH